MQDDAATFTKWFSLGNSANHKWSKQSSFDGTESSDTDLKQKKPWHVSQPPVTGRKQRKRFLNSSRKDVSERCDYILLRHIRAISKTPVNNRQGIHLCSLTETCLLEGMNLKKGLWGFFSFSFFILTVLTHFNKRVLLTLWVNNHRLLSANACDQLGILGGFSKHLVLSWDFVQPSSSLMSPHLPHCFSARKYKQFKTKEPHEPVQLFTYGNKDNAGLQWNPFFYTYKLFFSRVLTPKSSFMVFLCAEP